MTNNKQQTAVEWLWEIAYNRELTVADWKQAKEIEKEKLEDAWVEGFKNWNPSKTFEDYYNETYGEGEQ